MSTGPLNPPTIEPRLHPPLKFLYYLFIIQESTHATAGLKPSEKKKKEIKIQRGKTSNTNTAIGPLIEDEEQNENQKKEKKEKNREQAPYHLSASGEFS